MQQHWENIGEEMHSFKEGLETLLEMLPQSAKIHKQVNVLNKAWTRLKNSVNAFDPYVTPVKSVKVDSPLLNNADFKATWKFWKDYLNEQHNINMRSRSELMALKRICDISKEKPETAIFYLEFAMSRMDRNFYVVNDTELPKDVKAKSAGVKMALPAQYQNKTNGSAMHGSNGKVKQKTIKEEIQEFKTNKRSKKPARS